MGETPREERVDAHVQERGGSEAGACHYMRFVKADSSKDSRSQRIDRDNDVAHVCDGLLPRMCAGSLYNCSPCMAELLVGGVMQNKSDNFMVTHITTLHRSTTEITSAPRVVGGREGTQGTPRMVVD